MKEGTKVKVKACSTGHGFAIGEVVVRRHGEYVEDDQCLGFYSEKQGLWYMTPDEYELVDPKAYAIGLLKEALSACIDAKFSRGVWEVVAVAIVAIEDAEMELDND